MSNLYKPHLEAARDAWCGCVSQGVTVIDATCGNGHDTLYLAGLALTDNSGQLFSLDIQSQALSKTRELLQKNLSEKVLSRIHLIQSCHSKFPAEILPRTVQLIVYNLGYLPGGDKAFTTMLETTKQSLLNAMALVRKGGMISVTCYPGHSEGKREEEALLMFAATLDSREWVCSHQRWLNRKDSPSLLLMQLKS